MRLLLGLLTPTLMLGGAAAIPFRLPDTARPAHYELELTIVPRESEFHGIARIRIILKKPAKSLFLHAKRLVIEQANISVNGAARSARTTVSEELLELDFAESVPAGPASLEIRYKGELSEKANEGLYRKNAGTDWYAYTTFTPIEARRAFPCFDEPAYKAPWRIILHVPQSDVAASNARLKSEISEPGGMKRVEFEETKLLASEVVAIAVGPFDVVDAGTAGARHIPVRILVPHGRGAEAASARTATAEILERLEEYTGIPYPWDKLDHVAVLDMPYGAVENPGLITYRDRSLLAPPERDTLERRRGMRATMAHELAHQWFGNLVTQAWWDDVWLSEGFATWLGGKIIDLELPAFERSIAAVNGRTQIMQADAKPGTRPVRLPMNSRAEMARVYGGIVYQKGAAILYMVEQWLGPEPFRRGLHTYLTEHALSNATTADLAAALTQASGSDVAPVLYSFLDQTGYPVIRAAAGCELQVADPVRRTIPVCVHGEGGVSQCAVLSETPAQLPPANCPAWVWPNRGGAGYFRVQLSGAMLETLMKSGWDQLTAPEKLSVIDDTAASTPPDPAVLSNVLPAMARDPQPAVTTAAYRLLLSIMTRAAPEDRAKYDALARQMLGAGRGRR